MEKRRARTLAMPTHDEIAAFAHLIWENEGKPEGRATRHWHEAEAQLRADYDHAARRRGQRGVLPAP